MIITFYIFPYFKEAERKKNTYICVVFVYESSYLLFLFFFLVIPLYSSYWMMTFLTAIQLCSMHFLGAFIVKYISLYLYFIKKSLYLLWPLDGKNWFLRKDPDAKKVGRQEKKGTTEDEMVGWHHRLDGHEFDQALGVDDGQGGLVCCSPWGCKELDTTERLNRTELIIIYRTNSTILFYTNFSLKQLYRYYFCN